MNWQTLRQSLLWCWQQLLVLGLMALVLVAVLVGLSRQFLPVLDDYRLPLAAELSSRIGLPVRLERVDGGLEGLSLRIGLHGLSLRDPAAPTRVLLTVPEIELRPAVWQSLRHLEPRVDVRLSGLDIHLDQLPDGRLQLRELAALAGSDPEAARQALRFALRQPALAISHSRIGLALQGRPAVSFSEIDVVNLNDGDKHRLAGRLHPSNLAEPIAIQLSLQGDALDWQASAVDLWLHLPVLPLLEWLPLPESMTAGVSELRGGGDYWLSFRQGRLTRVQSRLDWQDVVLDRGQGRQHLQQLRGELAWQALPQGWRLSGQGLSGQLNGLRWPAGRWVLERQPQYLELAAAGVDIGAAAALARSRPELPAALAGWLSHANPRGELQQLRARLKPSGQGDWRPVQVDARWQGLSLVADGHYPGGQELAAWLRWTPERAWLGLETGKARLDLPAVFREPVPLQSLAGHLRLEKTAGVWRLDSDVLSVRNPDARGSAVISLRVPQDDPGAARLSLLAGLTDANAASTWRYVPWTATGDDTLAWLKQSIRAGKVSHGHFLYEGPLLTRPDLEPHHLEMAFAVDGGQLAYDPDWPVLRELAATVRIDGPRLVVSSPGFAMLDNTRVGATEAEIPDLHKPVLTVKSAVTSSGDDLMRLFRESALRRALPGLTDELVLAGPVSGELGLEIALADGATDIDVSARLPGNRLRVVAAGLEASQLTGELRYSSRQGLRAPALSAQWLESPVKASVNSLMRRGQLAAVTVDVAGQVTVPALRRWLANPLLEVVSGGFPYRAHLQVPVDAGPTRLQLQSNLVGLRVDMPAPLGKPASESVSSSYQSSLGRGEQSARLQYGQQLAAGLIWSDKGLERGLFRVGTGTPAWPQNPGLELEGRMARLDASQWQSWWQRLSHVGSAVGRGDAGLPGLSRASLQADVLLVDGLRFESAQIGLRRQGGAWLASLASAPLAGQLLVPDATAADWQLSIDHLNWPFPADALRPAAPASTSAAAMLSPGSLSVLGQRPIQIKAEGVRLAKWAGLGPLSASAHLLPSPGGLRLDDISVDSKALNAQGRLDWQWRGGVGTRVNVSAQSTDVAGLLSALGYAPTLLSPSARLQADLSWPGGPEDLQAAGLDGKLSLSLEHGRLLNVSNVASASRVFGWFDVDNLKRRFKGDFSDVMKRGLSFDTASLSGTLQGGVMTPADFRVDGPSLKAEGHGRLDFVRQQMDQQFTVTVPVSSAVPVAAVVVAGPLVGGAVAAAQMAFDRQIDKATRLHYHVSGSWSDPKVERNNPRSLPASAAASPPATSLLSGGESNGGATP